MRELIMPQSGEERAGEINQIEQYHPISTAAKNS
jgi:hypothetical protein